MRTTLALDDDIHEFASVYARAKGLTLGEAINELIRKGQAAAPSPKQKIPRAPNGLPMFPPTENKITPETVKELEEEDYDPKLFA